MEEFWVIISIGLGFVLRIGIPLFLTFLIGRALLKLDANWKEDGKKINIRDLSRSERRIDEMTCWEFFECSDTDRANCEKFGLSAMPSWQLSQAVVGDSMGSLKCKYMGVKENVIPASEKIGYRD
ncbi:MAG: hypothetical protein HON98_00430 [Chloroflexi bacterium]|jgi:hypothetical protein|nr:hypothetical protein [Chloroflexota bacterium]MBT4004284.1 hypothetical protein [Chloroflexota bacterium]MBT4305719.1 hypothetical protein [Chloroflexota bacterium]MBT4533543.1 hypothetical protein [Chloroflexota bacterium]MBT4681814.1 hypothetical protein [Chloroflexota bacterium]